jgi:hypothetical protein
MGLAGCGSGPQTPPDLRAQRFDYAGPDRCDSTAGRGVSIRANWFELSPADPASRAITDSLRALVVGNVSGWLDSATVAAHPGVGQNLPHAARLFAEDYRRVRADNRFVTGCWTLETQCDTVFVSANTFTARLQTYAYTGGAHPNAYVNYVGFDRRTGQALRLTDMVRDTVALLGEVERAFRKRQGLGSGQNLEAEGYFLRDGRFFLPDNVAPGRTGLICHYNPYDIAAYAEGPIELIIPYERVALKREL